MAYEEFLTWAEGKGWLVARRTVPLRLPEELTRRYRVPEEYLDFLKEVLLCASPMDTEWFLCEENYRETDPDAIRWNEFEELSLSAARDLMDPEEEARVVSFWDKAFPFFLSVGGGYEYYAFDLGGEFGPKGGILHGWEPEFEEPEAFAQSFSDFLSMVQSGKVPLGGVLFDPEEYAFMEMAGRREQERKEREARQALRELLHPRQEPEDCCHHSHTAGEGCCGHSRGGEEDCCEEDCRCGGGDEE